MSLHMQQKNISVSATTFCLREFNSAAALMVWGWSHVSWIYFCVQFDTEVEPHNPYMISGVESRRIVGFGYVVYNIYANDMVTELNLVVNIYIRQVTTHELHHKSSCIGNTLV